MQKKEGSKKKVNKCTIGIVIAFFVVIVSACGEDKEKIDKDEVESEVISQETSKENEGYLDCIELDDSSVNGAVLDCSFEEAKAIIEETLNVGGSDSSSAEWVLVSETETERKYWTLSSDELWQIYIFVNSWDKICCVHLITEGSDMDTGKWTDYEIECFSEVFAKLCGRTEDSVLYDLKNLLDLGISISGNYENGLAFIYSETKEYYEFEMVPMSKAKWDDFGKEIKIIDIRSDEDWENDILVSALQCEVIIHEGVTYIPEAAFADCGSLISITIPESVTSVGESAFENCENLTSIILPEGMTSIGYKAFKNCTNLTSITIPDSVASIGSYAFDGCKSLSDITIPSNVIAINPYTFYDCDSLKKIIIPDNVIRIKKYAFAECDNLKNITIPGSATDIDYSFYPRGVGLKIYGEANSRAEEIAESNNLTFIPIVIFK